MVLNDGNLKGLWKKIRLVNRECHIECSSVNQTRTHRLIQWINAVEHDGFVHSWIKCEEKETAKTNPEKKQQFVHLTDIEIGYGNCIQVSSSGRLRWKIEKQGFDQQKNHG